MGLRSLIPFRSTFWEAQHGKALKVKKEGHDVVAEIEWSDGNCTYMGADYEAGESIIRLENGLPIEIAGHGGEPVFIAGVPIIRVHAEHACPVDTDVAIAIGREEDGDYTRVDEHGNEIQDVDADVDPLENGAPTAEATAIGDGGYPTQQDVHDHEYDISPQGDAEGTAFSLRDAVNYVPNTLSPMALKRAEERGKQSAREHNPIKTFLFGAAAMIGVLIILAVLFVAVWKILGLGGGGGGGGSTTGMVLLLFASTSPIRERFAAIHGG